MTKSPYTPCLCMLEKDVPSKTSEFGSCAMFLFSLLLGALFAERYASESFQILGTSPAKAISPNVFKKTGEFDDKCVY